MLLASDKISLITFLIFLFVAVRIYEPLTKACEMLGEMIYVLDDAGMGRLKNFFVKGR